MSESSGQVNFMIPEEEVDIIERVLLVKTYDVRFARERIECDFPLEAIFMTDRDHSLQPIRSCAEKQNIIRIYNRPGKCFFDPGTVRARVERD